MENEKRIDKICGMLDDLVAASKRSTKPESVEKQVKTPDFYLGYKTGFEAAQPKWISVEERLPEENKPVLVFDELHGVGISFHSRYTNSFVGLSKDVLFGSVTHWMPLPLGPNDNKEEQ